MINIHRLYVIFIAIFSGTLSFGMEYYTKRMNFEGKQRADNAQKKARKIDALQRLIASRVTMVQQGEKEKSYLDEPIKLNTCFAKTPLMEALEYYAQNSKDLSWHDSIASLLKTGANPLYYGSMGGPLGEVTNQAMAKLLLEHSDAPDKYTIAFSALLSGTFDKWEPSERKEYLAWLLEQGVNPNDVMVYFRSNDNSCLPLITLACTDILLRIPVHNEVLLLLQYGADPNKEDPETKQSVYEWMKEANPELAAFVDKERTKIKNRK